MLKNILLISTIIVSAYAGQLSILQHPSSLTFKGNDALNSESLGDVLAATIGYSTVHPSDWSGLYITDPFNPARGVVALLVDGIDKLNLDAAKPTTFEVDGNDDDESLDSLLFRVQEHNSAAVDLDLVQGLEMLNQYNDIFGDFKVKPDKMTSSLKPKDHPEDKLFVEQLAAINELADKLATLEDFPIAIKIHISVGPLIAAHTLSSPAVTDALKLLSAAAENLSNGATKGYNGDVVVAIITNGKQLARSKRAADDQKDPITVDLNLAKTYSSDYPVIFNIILWFGVVLTFTLLAISYTIAYMDPGRDSIIYRMTSNRMKKDN